MVAAELWAPRLTRLALIGGVTVWCLNALIHWWLAAPLGHDEARYALDARDLWAGHPERFFYSGPGMRLVALPGVVIGGSELALRWLPMLLGFGFLASAWCFARTVGGRAAAAWTVAVLAGSPPMAVHGSELLSDLPSTALLLLAMTVLVHELRAGGLRRRIVVVAPLCAAAFYLRYGSCVPIAIIGVVFAIAGCRAIVRRPWPVVAMLVVFIVLLVPHVMTSLQLTGSPLGLLRMSAEIPGEAHGIAGYLRDPAAKYGVLIAPLMVIGLVAARRERFVIAVQLVAAAQVIVLASTTQAQPRFIYLATVVLVTLGIDAIARIGTRVARRRAVPLAVALVLASALWATTLVTAVTRHRDGRLEGASRALVAAAIIKADRNPHAGCELVAPDERTRLEWYSGCRAVIHPQRADVALYEIRDGLHTSVPDGATRVGFVPGFVDVIRIR